MAGLLEIKKKIKSVKNTSKITKAMQLVAGSKMRLFQTKALSTRTYMETLLSLLHAEVGTVDTPSPYEQIRSSGKRLFLLYTSDKGLCGGLNNTLQKALFQSSLWKNTPPEDRLLITLGKKARDAARAQKVTPLESFIALKEKFTTLDLLPIISRVLEEWDKEEIQSVHFVAPYYKNSLTFYPILKQFLPFSSDMVRSFIGLDSVPEKQHTLSDMSLSTLFEPSASRVRDVLHVQIMEAAFVESLYELKASEYSSRMIAMQNATESALKIVNRMTLSYNKIRQQAITQQIAEISNAAEAFSS